MEHSSSLFVHAAKTFWLIDRIISKVNITETTVQLIRNSDTDRSPIARVSRNNTNKIHFEWNT